MRTAGLYLTLKLYCFSDREEVRLKLQLAHCLEAFAKEETVEQFFSTAINGNTVAKK